MAGKSSNPRIHKVCFLLLAIFSSLSCRQEVKSEGDQKVDVQLILDSAGVYLNSGQPGHYIYYIDSAISRIQSPSSIDKWLKYTAFVNYYLNYDKNNKLAMRYADSSLFVLRDGPSKHKYEYAISLFTKGDVLLSMKDYEGAYDYYFQGKTFADRHLDDCSKSELSYRMGLVRYRQDNFSRAIVFFHDALSEKDNCRDTSFKSVVYFHQAVLNAVALSFEQMGKGDSAIYYYQKSLRIIQNNMDRYPQEQKFMKMANGVIYGNLGGVYANMGRTDLAEKNLLVSISLNDKAGYAIEDAQTAKLKLASLYLTTKEFEKSANLLQQVASYINKGKHEGTDNSRIEMRWSSLKIKYLAAQGDADGAYSLLKSYVATKDSIGAASQNLRLADFDKGMDNAKERYRIALLAKDNEQKSLFLYGSIILLFFAGLSLTLVVRNLKVSKSSLVKMTLLKDEIEQHNIQIKNSLEDLQQSQQDNTDLLQVIAHDLRNPIGSMIVAGSMIMREKGNSPKISRLLGLIKRSGDQAISLINDLLDSNGKTTEFKKQKADIYDILFYCVKMLSHKALEKRQEIKLNAFHFQVYVNREKIWRVISNLLSNAVKFTQPGRAIELNLEVREKELWIIVKDEGMGIPDDVAATLFTKYPAGSRSGTEGEVSYGLGLSISKQIVEAHQGKIWFEQNDKQGTTFIVALPL